MLHNIRLDSVRIVNAEPIAINQFNSPPDQPPVVRRGANLHYAVSARTERGTFRRAALAVCLGETSPISVDTYFFNAVGGARGREKVTIGPREKAALCARNPIIEALGTSAPEFIEGRVAVMDAVAIDPVEYGHYEHRNVARRNDIVRGEVPLDRLTDPERAFDKAEQVSIRAALNRAIEELRGKPIRGRKPAKPVDPADVLDKLSRRLQRTFTSLAEVEAAFATADADMGTESVAVQMVQETKPVIPRGTEMQQRILFRDISDAGCGLFLAAMHHHALRDPRIGGWRNAGCGGVLTREYRVLRLDGNRWVHDAMLSVVPYEGVSMTPVADNCVVPRVYDAWQATDLRGFDFTYPGGVAD